MTALFLYSKLHRHWLKTGNDRKGTTKPFKRSRAWDPASFLQHVFDVWFTLTPESWWILYCPYNKDAALPHLVCLAICSLLYIFHQRRYHKRADRYTHRNGIPLFPCRLYCCQTDYTWWWRLTFTKDVAAWCDPLLPSSSAFLSSYPGSSSQLFFFPGAPVWRDIDRPSMKKNGGLWEWPFLSPASLSVVFVVSINDASCAQFSNNGLSWMNIFHFPWYVNSACKHFWEVIRLRVRGL